MLPIAKSNSIGYAFCFSRPIKIAKNCVLLYLLSGNYCQIVTIFFCSYLNLIAFLH